MAISTEDLKALAERARKGAQGAGELRPPRTGPLAIDLPDEVRQAIDQDLRSGEYRRAADDAVAGDPDLAQL